MKLAAILDRMIDLAYEDNVLAGYVILIGHAPPARGPLESSTITRKAIYV